MWETRIKMRVLDHEVDPVDAKESHIGVVGLQNLREYVSLFNRIQHYINTIIINSKKWKKRMSFIRNIEWFIICNNWREQSHCCQK